MNEDEVWPKQIGEFWIDQNGEIINDVAEPGFTIDTMEKVEWLMEKLFNHGALKDMHLKKIVEFTKREQALADKEQRVIDWLKQRYSAEAELVIREELAKSKKPIKSISNGFGKIGFKLSQGGRIVRKIREGMEAFALSWCEENCPDAVKVKPEERSVLVSKLPATADLRIFEFKEPEEQFIVEVG